MINQNSFPVKIYTNIDEYQSNRWPTSLMTIPRIGERICPIVGAAALRVVGIIHHETYIEIELTK